MSLTPEQIHSNFELFRNLCSKTGDRADKIVAMVDSLGEELALCPASGRTDYHNAFPGGLVEHSIRVLNNANKLVKTYGWQVRKDSLIIGALFHDLGKVGQKIGDEFQPYYVTQESDWHRTKLGEMYKHNEKLPYMTVPQRGVFLLQSYGVELERDEYLAIILNDGWVLQENKSYCLKEPILATVVMTADYISTYQEKYPEYMTT